MRDFTVTDSLGNRVDISDFRVFGVQLREGRADIPGVPQFSVFGGRERYFFSGMVEVSVFGGGVNSSVLKTRNSSPGPATKRTRATEYRGPWK